MGAIKEPEGMTLEDAKAAAANYNAARAKDTDPYARPRLSPDALADPAGPSWFVEIARPEGLPSNLMTQTEARRTAKQQNDNGLEGGMIAVATPWPLNSWGGEQKGWVVVYVSQEQFR